MDTDPLERFLDAQANGIYESALAEIQAGKKRRHWMWFIFPQLKGLGFSSTSQFYGIAGMAEAEVYLAHPILGVRLAECTQALLVQQGRSSTEIFGHPDDLKLCSCLTLFSLASKRAYPFDQALQQYFQGQQDSNTLQLLAHT